MWTAAILLALVFLALAEGQSVVSLRLQVVSYSSDATDACIGGDVGLTETSVLVQYRFITSVQSATQSTTTDWRTLTKIDPKIGLDETLNLTIPGSSALGVEFRLLQLEHGGGSCNCWSVEEAIVESIGGLIINQEVGMCFRTQESEFCGGTASRARGFISTPTLQTSTVNDCPERSSEFLIAPKESPLPQNCSAMAQIL